MRSVQALLVGSDLIRSHRGEGISEKVKMHSVAAVGTFLLHGGVSKPEPVGNSARTTNLESYVPSPFVGRTRTRAPFRGRIRTRPTPATPPEPAVFRGRTRTRLTLVAAPTSTPLIQSPPPRRRGRAPSHIPDPWCDLEWEEHPAAQQAVREHPAGMTLEEIGECMNITRERVRQIEHQAIAKLAQNTGSDITWLGGLTIAVPECRKCGEAFVRKTGRQDMCDACDATRKRKRPAMQQSASLCA